MDKLRVDLAENSYDILFSDSFSGLADGILSVIKSKKCLIVTDSTVDKLYADEVEKRLSDGGFSTERFVFFAGEENKTIDTVLAICRACLAAKLDRKSFIVALGGGVCGDMAGFAAAVYMRGIDFVQIPTTLLSQSDSSVGGKTGVDFCGNKNFLGAFHQPKLVYINVSVLKTLPEREFISGMGEVIKHGMIADSDFFDYIGENAELIKQLKPEVMMRLCRRNCEIKASVVSADEKEQGLREILNFGHTVGHAVEVYYNFDLSHGECVGIGMYAAVLIAEKKGLIDEKLVKKLEAMLEKYGFGIHIKIKDCKELIETMKRDKKAKNGVIRFILPQKIGAVSCADDVSETEIMQALEELKDKH